MTILFIVLIHCPIVLLPQVVAITLTTEGQWASPYHPSLSLLLMGEPILAATSEVGTASAFGHGVGG